MATKTQTTAIRDAIDARIDDALERLLELANGLSVYLARMP